MKVNIPHDMPSEVAADIKAGKSLRPGPAEQQVAAPLAVAAATPTSAFLIADNAELQDLISNLPLFPFMDITGNPCRHPSSIRG